MDEAILRSFNALADVPFFAALAVVLSSKWFALAIGAADVVCSQLIKPAVARERPCRALTGLVQPVRCGAGRSFPSNHAVNALAFLLATAPLFRFGWPILAPIALAIAGSRLVLGVHYPTDLIGGAVIGSIFGALAWAVRIRLEKRLSTLDSRLST